MTGLEVITVDPKADSLQWQRLADRALEPNPFFAPAFLRAYLTHMERRPVAIAAVRDRGNDHLLALAPFGRRRIGLVWPATVAWATAYGPLGTPLVAPEATAATLDLLFRYVVGPAGLVLLPYLRTDGPVHDLIQDLHDTNGWRLAMARPQMRAGHVAAPTGQEQYDRIGGSRRKEIERQLRRLAELGTVAFASLGDVDATEIAGAFEDFLHLEARGWKGSKGSALAADPRRAAFARAFIATAAARGQVRIDRLTLDGRPIAMLVLLRDGHRILSWKIAFDEEFGRFSPGAQITRYAMRRNLADPEFTDADSLAVPDHPMITPLWRGKVPYATALLGRGAIASLSIGAARLDLSAEHRLRRGVKAALRRGRYR